MYTILMLLLLLLPFALYFTYESGFKRETQGNSLVLKLAFNRMVRRNRLSISHIENFGNRIIALDRRNRKLILMMHKDSVAWEKYLSLDEISSFKINRELDQFTGDIQSIDLEIILTTGERGQFSFFNVSSDSVDKASSRLKKAMRWSRRIRLQLDYMEQANKFEYSL